MGRIGFFMGKIKIPASAMGLQRAVLAHGGHRLNVFYFHWIPQRSLGNEACNTRTELSSQFEGVGSLILPIEQKAGTLSNCIFIRLTAGEIFSNQVDYLAFFTVVVVVLGPVEDFFVGS